MTILTASFSLVFADYQTQVTHWLATAGEDHMSPVGMFMAADVIVKTVMLILIVASVLVWAIFAARLILLIAARIRLRRNYRVLDRAGHLDRNGPFRKGGGVVGAMVRVAMSEITASQGADRAGIKERTDSALSRIEAGAGRGMQRGTALLAITGSSAPFIGLFGTVWGIMNSFVSIAETNTTNLAVVAPGIAEALLATAMGLVAAIPAVIFFNLLARFNGAYKAMLADASALVSRHLSRDLDLAAMTPQAEPEAAIAVDTPAPVVATPALQAAE
ncbi:biopolymer transport protein ExbB [Loktanella ponticola]|uniref:Biopolymer transport protein ExbB n=1 Tax=Yoonia ponticola TaxID=1524255 RepID=A0A7W9BJ14_9RHOB|nr:tonB-system energizer ExbB [Yoonia ponticola]MBB5721429.1 biopolymer transport protein ExbB [Yoonia ponticola]